MAKKTSRGARAVKVTAREAKAKSKKPVAAEVEVVQRPRGEGVDTAIVVITSLVLLAAILFTDAFRGASGEGMFF